MIRLLLVAGILLSLARQATAADVELTVAYDVLNRAAARYRPHQTQDSGADTGCSIVMQGDTAAAETGTTGVRATAPPIGEVRVLDGARYLLVLTPQVDAGVVAVPVVDVTWRYWITGARFAAGADGQLTFSATVHTVVNGVEATQQRTVPVKVDIDTIKQRLRFRVGGWNVPLYRKMIPPSPPSPGHGYSGPACYQKAVEVSELYSFSLPLSTWSTSVPMPDYTRKTLSGRVSGVSATALDALHLQFDLEIHQ